ncbi:MAG: hypothetical protein ACYCOU_02820 [Sulfobacillus sp.]
MGNCIGALSVSVAEISPVRSTEFMPVLELSVRASDVLQEPVIVELEIRIEQKAIIATRTHLTGVARREAVLDQDHTREDRTWGLLIEDCLRLLSGRRAPLFIRTLEVPPGIYCDRPSAEALQALKYAVFLATNTSWT